MCDMLIFKAEIKSCSYAKHVIIPGVYIFICLEFQVWSSAIRAWVTLCMQGLPQKSSGKGNRWEKCSMIHADHGMCLYKAREFQSSGYWIMFIHVGIVRSLFKKQKQFRIQSRENW